MKITTIGLDIAKSVFHLFAVNKMGKLVKKKQLKRRQLLAYMANLEPCLIVMWCMQVLQEQKPVLIALGVSNMNPQTRSINITDFKA